MSNLSIPVGMILLWAAGAAIAQTEEPQSVVDRVIKAAQDIHFQVPRELELQPKAASTPSDLYLAGHLVNLTGDASLEERLVGSAQTFADGPRVESDVRAEISRLGYRWQLQSAEDPNAWLPVAIHSVVGVAVVDLQYEFEGMQRVREDEGLLRGAPMLGFDLEWFATPRLSVAGEITSTAPLGNMPWIFTGQILGRYQISGHRDKGVRAFLGMGYQRVSLQDQAINSIDSDSGPMLLIGVEARF